MKLGSRQSTLAAAGTVLVCLLSVPLARGQAGPEQRPQMAEDVFKNVQVLKGIPVDQFMATMGFFSASLGMSCEDCHSADDRNWEGFAVDNPRKRTARKMITMMAAINRDNFGGRQIVTCYSCHRGGDRPRVTPDLHALYGALPPADPNEVIAQAPGAPSADQVLDKYLQALGGPQRVAALTSFVATGTSAGYGPESEKRPVEIFAKAPGQRTLIIHTSNGDNTTTYDGRVGWIADRTGAGRRQAGRGAVFSRADQASPWQMARRLSRHHRRSRSRRRAGNHRRGSHRNVILRQGDGPARADGALYRLAGRPHSHGDRLR